MNSSENVLVFNFCYLTLNNTYDIDILSYDLKNGSERYLQGRFQTFTQGGAICGPPWNFLAPPAGGCELAQGGAKEETKYL